MLKVFKVVGNSMLPTLKPNDVIFTYSFSKMNKSDVVVLNTKTYGNIIKRIAIIKEFEHSYNSEKRFQGYLRALKTHNIPIDEKLILSTDDISLNKGKMLASQLISLKERPDAIFSITDAAAVGVIQTLKKFNITIPEEIAVVGFSNSLISTIVEPNLTTTDQPGKRIGELAVDYLIREIQEHNSYANSKTIEIKTNLIIRASTFLPI